MCGGEWWKGVRDYGVLGVIGVLGGGNWPSYFVCES